MPLAIFDLDNTLLCGDSDYLWGQYLCDIKVVDSEEYQRKNQQFYDDYEAGQLDIQAFIEFSFKPLSEHPLEQLQTWRKTFIERKITPHIGQASRALVKKHRAQGDTLLIITATNRFVTELIAEKLGIPNLIATEPELQNNRYTGRLVGTPSFREGKITRLNEWLNETGENLEGACFYSDSFNDLPLLELVDNPIATNPDKKLRAHAEQQNWPILQLCDKT